MPSTGRHAEAVRTAGSAGGGPVRIDHVPLDLRQGPFRASQAERLGVSRHALRGKAFRRVFTGVYVWAGLPDGGLLRARAAALVLPRGAVLTGLSALWVRGILTPVQPVPAPVHILVPTTSRLDPRPGIRTWSAVIRDDEIELVAGLPVATVSRSLVDLGRRLPTEVAVAAADAAIHRWSWVVGVA